mmetsp:Transcript_36311/g.43891  ORF Transcript_36311/g.43891 Transcript_36311/m.43891 type:complete len:255 (+) Transcript_36311:86-850(+)|eukprot:CAMPEP_0197848062 /NCGR_PEP_ID=MMETSP1438-20131217/7904_1 /TAXON_ID=1461541 /ORGANISM="Pterosperma sp., Strain CCMP1384" /LENGTH=254 /DNA_ID=CAMNT_0043460189 /DNA_START=83 /DNA_END=847 /DNA_ORIENTATION=-
MSHAIQKSLVLPRVAKVAVGERAQARSVAPAHTSSRSRPVLTVRSVASVDSASDEVKKERKKSPLEAGGTLTGDKAFGKDAGAGALGKAAFVEKFEDPRWVKGRWDYAQFADKDGETDWDAVIDAEIRRRRILEDNPETCVVGDEVVFDTNEIPWTAWVKRFHLPEAELINGRAAMVGFAMAYLVDLTTGVSIVDATNSFWGKCLMGTTLLGCLVVRRLEDLKDIKVLADEATFYDKQWAASWEGVERPSETEN